MQKFTGIVQKGSKRGRRLGYPTINIVLTDTEVSGVYAARVRIKKDDAPYVAAVFADPNRKILEAHVLNFSDDLYGLSVTIELHEKIRDKRDFVSDDELKKVIAEDILNVKRCFEK